MSRVIRASDRFSFAVAILFAFVLLGLGIATLANAALSYDGAFFLFRVLDTHRFAADHYRLINIPLQVPVMLAARYTDSLPILRAVFCVTYTAIPLVGLALSWLLCKPRRPSLFAWPALSICIAGLPGQFSFQSEAIMAVTLLWPALLAVLLGATTPMLTLVAIASIGVTFSHPSAALVLAFIVLVAVACAVTRPRSRRRSIGFAVALGALLVARLLMQFDPYEDRTFSFETIFRTFDNSMTGWPPIALTLTVAAAIAILFPPGRRHRAFMMIPLLLAGGVLVAWASDPVSWANCNDYRYWIAPISMLFMAGAVIQEIWLNQLPEQELQDSWAHVMPLIGSIFCVVLAIQSIQWIKGSRRLLSEVIDAGPGCASHRAIDSFRNTALDHWAVTFYAIELQGRSPAELFLPDQLTCDLFQLNGDAMLVHLGSFTYVRRRSAGWFDFEKARLRMKAAGS